MISHEQYSDLSKIKNFSALKEANLEEKECHWIFEKKTS